MGRRLKLAYVRPFYVPDEIMGIIYLTCPAIFLTMCLLRVQTEISRSHSTTRGIVHTGTSQQGDGSTNSSTQRPTSPFFMRVVFSVHDKNDGKRVKVAVTELTILLPPRLRRADGGGTKGHLSHQSKTCLPKRRYAKKIRDLQLTLRPQTVARRFECAPSQNRPGGLGSTTRMSSK